MLHRSTPVALAALIVLVACTDLIGPRGGDSVRLVVQPSFGQIPAAAVADDPASRVDNVHVLLRNAAGTVVLDTIVEWPLDQDTLRMEMDVVVQETESYDLTLEGRSGDQLLFQAGPISVELSDDDSGSTVATTPVLEYAGPGAEVASVDITGAPGSFLAGSVVTLGATGANDDGSEPEELIIVWTSLDPDAASVDEDGAVQVGHDASRAVSIEARVAFTTITDTIGGPVLPAELTVSPGASTLSALGADLSLTASLVGEDGGDVTGMPIEWSVAEPSVLDVGGERDGGREAVATALTPGTTRVIATAGELADSVDVAVEQVVARVAVDPDSATLGQVGATAQASATAFDANDNEVEDASVDWSSRAADVVTVAEDGTITAVSPGAAWIIATSDEAADSLRATVLNIAPDVGITAPSDGATFEEGAAIALEGTAEDVEDGDLSAEIEWASDTAGELGTGASVTAELESGQHTITAAVTDADGETASASIEVTVRSNTAPVVTIVAPEQGAAVPSRATVTFEGTATDEQEGDISESMEWSSDLDGPLGTGASVVAEALSPGTHQITAVATDAIGETGSSTISIEVVVTVTGTVFYSTEGIPEVTVELVEGETASGEPSQSTTTDADGEYAFVGVPDGTYWVKAYGPTDAFIHWIAGQVTVAGEGVTENLDLPKDMPLQSPADGSGTLSQHPALEWEANPEAASYTVQINVTDGFDLVEQTTGITTNSYTVETQLDVGETYTWQVDAYDDAGHYVGTSQQAFTFTVGAHAVGGTIFYGTAVVPDIVVDLESQDELGPPPETTTTDAEGSYLFPAVPDGQYLLSVVQPEEFSGIARAAVITIEGGDVTQDFRLQKELTLLSPLDGAEVADQPLLEWETFTDAARYRIRVVLHEDPRVLVEDPITTGTSHTVEAGLTPGEVYQWRVDADDEAGNWIGATVQPRTFIAGGESAPELGPIAAGRMHSLGVTTDLIAAGWGDDTSGQASPSADWWDVVAVAAGGSHSLGLMNDGTVIGWGDDSMGQATPPSGLTDVMAIAAGESHSLALNGDGTVVAWGDDYSGQTLVPEGLSDAVAIAAGTEHSLALKSDGTLVSWGVQSAPDLHGVGVAIAAGGFHSMALMEDGTVEVWWDAPQPPTDLTDVIDIAVGGGHFLALLANGTVVGWGEDGEGQATPPEGLSNVVAIAAGGSHSLALLGDGSVVGWGRNTEMQTEDQPGPFITP